MTAICLSMPINLILTVLIMLVELNLLRNVDANNTENSTTVKNSSLLSGFRGGSSYNHETETILRYQECSLTLNPFMFKNHKNLTLPGMWKTIFRF